MQAYLTIDDSPTQLTGELLDFLKAEDVSATIFIRGERVETYGLDVIVRAICEDHLIGNHLFDHLRNSEISFDEVVRQIEKTEVQIGRAYQLAGVKRPGKYIRFPHIDRGTAGWVVDYDKVPEQYRDTVRSLFLDGLNVKLDPPTPERKHKKKQIQDYLAEQGFTNPYHGVEFPWYAQTEVGQAIDALYTFSTSDWMMTARHQGNHRYKTIEDLKTKIAEDPLLKDHTSSHIILMHDDPEDIIFVTRSLVHYMKDEIGIEFIHPL